MADEGWVEMQVVPQEDRPDRKGHSTTTIVREILQALTDLQHANLFGIVIVTDELDDSAQVDSLLQALAENLVWCAEAGYIRPPTFLGVGGMKVFRDDIWGRFCTVFQADHLGSGAAECPSHPIG